MVFNKGDVTDPYVDVRLGKAKLVKTTVILNDLNPKWNESYRTEVCHFADHLSFEIRDKVCILFRVNPKEITREIFLKTLRNCFNYEQNVEKYL